VLAIGYLNHFPISICHRIHLHIGPNKYQ
jgi:hypothetical protein